MHRPSHKPNSLMGMSLDRSQVAQPLDSSEEVSISFCHDSFLAEIQLGWERPKIIVEKVLHKI